MPQIAYAGWALVAGILIPILASLSGSLGRAIGSPVSAAVVTVTVAALGVYCVAAFSGANFSQFKLLQTPAPQLLAGLCMSFYIVSITFLAPRFGVGNAIMFVVAGQIIASAAIDHFGLLGAVRHPIDAMRALGLVVMIVGVVIAQMAASAAQQRPAHS